MIVVGTAGHIDHGKSAIVRRLTGTDPDRLPEEKKRGMTIDLGFAFYRASDEHQLALVDVPGHERFVKNMIAGAGGIDAVMLVIAADDGWMPQSEEHFQITRLLGVRHGFIVINKIDLAEPDWIDLLQEDVTEKVSGSFLEGRPVFRVSAETGEGFDQLREHLNDLVVTLEARRDIGKARLPIDRSFVRAGIGGVVTGTLRGGSLEVGQMVSIWPSLQKGKVRTLQSSGNDVERAEPGQRTAVSLTGVDRENLVRGGVITAATDLGYFIDRPVLALNVEMLHQAAVPLEDRRRGLLLVGTAEVEGEIRMFDRRRLQPGEQGLVFFRPDSPQYAMVSDRFVLRLPSPMVTLGGGAVLDHLPAFPRRRQLSNLAYLEARTEDSLARLIESELDKETMAPAATLLSHADYAREEIDGTVAELIDAGTVGRFDKYLFGVKALEAAGGQVVDAIEQKLKDQPHLKGLPLDQVSRLVPRCRSALRPICAYLVSQGKLVERGDLYDLAGRGLSLKGIIKQAHDDIIVQLTEHRLDPPQLSQLAGKGKVYQQAIKYILDTGEGYKCGSSFIFLTEVWDEITGYVSATLSASGELSVANLREQFGFTRKYAIPLLEELDRIGLTERRGDVRVKGTNFEA